VSECVYVDRCVCMCGVWIGVCVHVWGVDVWVRGILASLADGGESLGDLVM